MLRHDYIGRLIQQLGEALARIAGLAGAGKNEEAAKEIADAERQLGLPLGAERLDARSVALLLGGADKVVLLALLCEQRARLASDAGDHAAARRHRARLLALLDHASPVELGPEREALRQRARADD